jgi:hypothetical protein
MIDAPLICHIKTKPVDNLCATIFLLETNKILSYCVVGAVAL